MRIYYLNNKPILLGILIILKQLEALINHEKIINFLLCTFALYSNSCITEEIKSKKFHISVEKKEKFAENVLLKINFDRLVKRLISENDSDKISKFFLVKVTNTDVDSLYVPIDDIDSIPFYKSSLIKYYNKVSDTIPIDVSLPFEIPDRLELIKKGEEKSFFTILQIGNNIAKVRYNLYLHSDKSGLVESIVVLTKKEGEIMQLD